MHKLHIIFLISILAFNCNAKAENLLNNFNEAVGLKKYDEAALTNVHNLTKESLPYDATKRAIGTLAIIKDLDAASNSYLKNIKESKDSIKKIAGSIDELTIKIGKYEWSKHLREYGKTEASKKAVTTLTSKINGMEKDVVNLKKLITPISKLDSIKYEDAKLFGLADKNPFASKLGTLSFIATTVDIGIDITKINERVNGGSTMTLEVLNILLKGVESFQPTIPGVATPSDVGRTLIDYQSALKERNKSLVLSNEIALNGAMSFIYGDASIEAYIFRKANDENFVEKINTIGISEAYKELRSEYMANHFSNYVNSLYETKELLEKEKADTWGIFSNDPAKMYESLINGIDMAIKNMTDKSRSIWSDNLGEDLIDPIYKINLEIKLAKEKQDQLQKNAKKITELKLKFDNLPVNNIPDTKKPNKIVNKEFIDVTGSKSNIGNFNSIVNIKGAVTQTATGSNVKQDLNVGSAQKSQANSFNAVVTTGSITQTGKNGAQQFINVGGMNNSKVDRFDAQVTTGNIEQIGNRGERQEMDIGSVTNSTVTGAATTRVSTGAVKQTGEGEISLGAIKNSNVKQFNSNLNVKGKLEGNNIRMGSVIGQEKYDNDGNYAGQAK